MKKVYLLLTLALTRACCSIRGAGQCRGRARECHRQRRVVAQAAPAKAAAPTKVGSAIGLHHHDVHHNRFDNHVRTCTGPQCGPRLQRIFYAARGAITVAQNGWAIAGDYMSAASFLGIAGLICLYGYDGFMYSVGWLVAYVTVLLIVAEPCRNEGKFTMGTSWLSVFPPSPCVRLRPFPLCSSRSSTSPLRWSAQASSWNSSSVSRSAMLSGVGCLMIVYVALGGMIATTWVQIIKAGLLMTGACLLCVRLVLATKAGSILSRFS